MVDNALIVNLLGENSQFCMHYAEPVARLQRVVLTHRTSSDESANLRLGNQSARSFSPRLSRGTLRFHFPRCIEFRMHCRNGHASVNELGVNRNFFVVEQQLTLQMGDGMEWYQVIKTIRGHRYLYEQRTWRDGKRVRTQSRYVGPALDSGARGPDPILASVVVGPVWRAESGYRHERGATAWDVIRYESEDLGNAYLREQVESVCRESDLRNNAADDLVWVTAPAKVARRYGSNISQFDLPAGWRIIAMDRDDGWLVLRAS
jgi:hypothetical protein